MPIEKNQVSFAGGEISPALYAHTDLVKYLTGLRKCYNAFVHIQGGVSNRAGTQYLNSLKDQTKRPRLVPFEFGVTQNYILEFTENLVRVFKDGGLVLEVAKTISGITQANPGVVTATAHNYSDGDWVYIDSVVGMTEVNNKFYKVANKTTNTFELQDTDGNNIDTTSYTAYSSAGDSSKIFELTTTYAESDLRNLKYTQSADIMTICHPSYEQSDLSRTAHYIWSLDAIEFAPEITWPTVASGTPAVSSSETYKYKITAVAKETSEESLSGTEATKNITGITQANPGVVTITGHSYDNGDELYLTSIGGMTELNGKRVIVAGQTANTFQLTDTDGNNIDTTSYTAYTSGGTAARALVEVTSAASISSTNYIDLTWTGVSAAQSYNVYRKDNGVYGFIGTTEETTFKDDITLPDLEDTPPRGRDPFEDQNYPAAVAYHKQRRVFGGPDANPQTIYGTQTANYKNMNVSSPTRDDDAFTFTLNSEQVQQVRHITSLKKLIVFTSGSSWLVKGGNDSEIITPTSVDADEEYVSGCAQVRPLRIGRDILYVEDGGKDIVYLNYSFEADGLDGESLTELSGHLFKRREILEWAWSRKPYSLIWCVTDTGELLVLTYNRKQQIWAWSHHETDGQVETVAVIQEGGEDVVYFGVKRTINGNTKRYVEKLHTREFQLVEDAFFVDSGLSLDTWNSNTSSMVKVSGGTDWTTDETLTMTENATLSPFSSSDVGKIIALRIKDDDGEVTARCRFLVTAYNSATSLDVTPETVVPTALQDVYTEHYSTTVTTLSGLSHLEGKTVSVLADGNVETQKTVSSGSITLDNNASKVHVGLPYNSDIETLDVDFTPQGVPGKTKKKGISEVTFVVEETRGLFAGPDVDNLTEYLQRENEDYNEPTALLTGKAEIAIQPSWSNGGRVYVRQSDPLPMTILAAIPEVELSD